jgi:hypothetical protein
MSCATAYDFLTKRRARWQTPFGQTLHARIPHMDIERINLIGTTLSDLATRTEALRGYL